MAALAGGAAAVGGCATSASTASAIAGDMAFGVLLHLGVHMWGDWTPDKSRIPNSPEELAKMYPDDTRRQFSRLLLTLAHMWLLVVGVPGVLQ